MQRHFRKLLLVGIDGADWQILRPLAEAGALPCFARLMEEGAMGNLATLQPTLSPILWNSIATGKRAGKHGIHGFTELDADRRVRPVSSLSRRGKAVWNILQQSGLRPSVVNWFASHPAEPLAGVAISDFFPNPAGPAPEPWPVPARSIHPAALAAAFSELRLHPSEIDSEPVDLFVHDLRAIDQKSDPRPGMLAQELARALTVQAATLEILRAGESDFVAAYFRVVDLLGHLFMPFRPPAREGVPAKLCAHYAGAVDAAYRFIDLLLHHLLAAAGLETTVLIVSDHGFHHALRPPWGPATFTDAEAWHREQGIILAAGPGVRRDELIHGASLLDLTPTILHGFGLPVGRDMDGRVLSRLFERPDAPEYLESWELRAGDCGLHPPGTTLELADSRALLAQFAALGYIEPPAADPALAARQTENQNRWNLARDYLDGGAWEDALPLLEELHEALPGSGPVAVQLAFCLWRLGLSPEAERALGDALAASHEGPWLSVLQGHLALESGREREAIAHFTAAIEGVPAEVGVRLGIAQAWARSAAPEKAEAAYLEVLAIDPENALGWHGLAQALAASARWAEAVEAALRAVALQHALPAAHATLAEALQALGCFREAVAAYGTSLVYHPAQPACHRALARLHRQLGDLTSAARHEQLAAETAAQTEAAAVRAARVRSIIEQRKLAREEKLLWGQAETIAELDAEMRERRHRLEQAAQRVAGRRTLPAGTEFVLVSGLPRSGTSLMMQMLAAGGLEPLTDGLRAADAHNPRGYFEWDEARLLPSNPWRIEAAAGKAVKIISMLLQALPSEFHYRILFMERPPAEIAASQRRLLESSAGADSIPVEALRGHRDRTMEWMQRQANVHFLSVPYPELVRQPLPWLRKIAEFLNRPLDLSRMQQSIDETLYRVRF